MQDIKSTTLMKCFAYLLMITVLALSACHKTPTRKHVVTAAERAKWPRTVDEAATRLIREMSKKDREFVRSTPETELFQFHHGWGTGIRNRFGLWRGNDELLADTRTQHPDDASFVIIKEVWTRLQK